MNVPETAVAVIASSTASQRQRIQRLGRVLRPSRGKDKAVIYTLFATEQEQKRLTTEAARLEGVASVFWATGTREEPMAKILLGDEWFDELASTSLYESEFETILFQEAARIFPEYYAVPFKSIVLSEDGDAKADFALIHRDYRSWWVVEAEMGHHSLEGHVLPQVRRLSRAIYPDAEAEYLCGQDSILDSARVREMIKGGHPRVLVVVNIPVPGWKEQLRPFNAVSPSSRYSAHSSTGTSTALMAIFLRKTTKSSRPAGVGKFIVSCKIDSPTQIGIKRGETITLYHETGAIRMGAGRYCRYRPAARPAGPSPGKEPYLRNRQAG